MNQVGDADGDEHRIHDAIEPLSHLRQLWLEEELSEQQQEEANGENLVEQRLVAPRAYGASTAVRAAAVSRAVKRLASSAGSLTWLPSAMRAWS